jgi:hypothetical protein
MAKGRKTGGRKPGTPNKNTTDVGAIARALVDDADYRVLFKARLHAGTIPPGVEQMLWHYAYGKPPDSLTLRGDEDRPVVVKFIGVHE